MVRVGLSSRLLALSLALGVPALFPRAAFSQESSSKSENQSAAPQAPADQADPMKRPVSNEQKKKNAKAATVTCRVSIGPRDAGGFGIAVQLHVRDHTLPQAELAALAREAHEKVCPYSHATRNNVPVELSVEGA